MSETNPLKLIMNIEFFEKHSSNLICPYTEVQVTVSDLEKFRELCNAEDKNKDYEKWQWDYEMKRAGRSTATKREPKFQSYFNGVRIEVYPRLKKVSNNQCGIHYIGQHLFDFIPNKDVFYQYREGNFVIGRIHHYLADKHPDRFPDYEVKSSDIFTGFMQSREENLKYGDSFYMFVRSRRESGK